MTDHADLTIEAFVILREHFFSQNGTPRPFPLREKRNTQDNPLDEYICGVLGHHLQDSECVPSPGPLISPDLALLRPDWCNGVPRVALRDDLTRVVGIEIKKLERTRSGSVARRSGLDYNTTPPCGTIRVYDANDNPLDIRGFYLFVCQEQETGAENTYQLSALALCDGNMLNETLTYISQPSANGKRKSASARMETERTGTGRCSFSLIRLVRPNWTTQPPLSIQIRLWQNLELVCKWPTD